MKKSLLHFVTSVALLLFFFPVINFAQRPNLGGAGNFVLFSSNGAVTNSGTPYLTLLTGNVGAQIGEVSGFGNVNGVMHKLDTASFRAAADLLLAYKYLDTLTPTAAHAPALGGGDTLNAGVYSIAGNTSLNQKLTLNGQGNANAVFIFKISAPLSTADSAKIILINNAQACNVFWKVEGLVSLAPGTLMRGTIIANNAAISIGTNVTLEGRALSTTGAVSVTQLLAYLPTGCGSILLSGPAAPDLGTTACYALFTGTGSNANNGVSYVTGDIGTNSGLTTGYDSLKVTGTIHKNPDNSTAGCAADLLNVYKYLDTIPYDIELLYPTQFGHNLVLTPHSYLLNAATVLTDTIYLNAEGYANAVFVIKVIGAFSTTTFAKVILMNGAQPSNVFWKVKGAVNMNEYSSFKGNIVCTDGAIDLKTGVTLEGRALTTNGAFSATAVNVTILPVGGCSTLPVTWLYFRGKQVQKNVVLEWGNANEVNNSFFTIEKSRDGQTFEKLTNVNAVASAGKEQYYSFTDQQPYPLTYYRILQTDRNGQKNYFKTIQVKMNTSESFKAMHYVQQNYIYLETSGAKPGNASIDLYDISGKKMYSQKIQLTGEINIYKIEKPLQKGVYLINLESRGEKLYNGKVMVL